MKVKLFGLIAAALLSAAHLAMAAPIGAVGPDSFGYAGNDLAYNFRDISTSGTAVSLGDDEVSSAVNIGFSFSFYGTSYTQAYISSNGFITFSANQSDGCCSSDTFPDVFSPDNLIAGSWNDLFPPGGGTIRYATSGVAGSREFVVGFYDIRHCCTTSPPTNSFEMILHEGSNDIELQWRSVLSDGSFQGVGIENADGSVGLQVARSATLSLAQQGYCISTGGTACGSGTAPEPGTLALLGLGLAGLAATRRRKQ